MHITVNEKKELLGDDDVDEVDEDDLILPITTKAAAAVGLIFCLATIFLMVQMIMCRTCRHWTTQLTKLD